MTSIKLMLTGAQAWASVTGPLTSGMVGIPITIEYDEAWEGLTKNLVCRCSPWGSANGEIRTILNVGENATVAHEVMQSDMYLHLGVEGFSNDGKLVMPTTWARCGKIEYGANTCKDPSTDPVLPIWNQLQVEMEETKEYVLTPEQAVNIQSYAQTAAQAAQEARQSAEDAKQAVESGLYYIPVVSQPTDTTLKFEFKPSLTGVPIPKPVTVELPIGSDSEENLSGLSAELQTALINYYTHVMPEFNAPNGMAYVNAILTALGAETRVDSCDTTEKVLTSICATYSGGSVAVGTAVSALTGVVVTATYDDGSTATVTGYTLSGSIAEGSNTVTVSYGGKTATFTVTGVAESVGAETDGNDPPFDAVAWTDGLRITATGAEYENQAAYSTCDYADVTGKSSITLSLLDDAPSGNVKYTVVSYSADKTTVLTTEGGESYLNANEASYPRSVTITLPDGAACVRICGTALTPTGGVQVRFYGLVRINVT